MELLDKLRIIFRCLSGVTLILMGIECILGILIPEPLLVGITYVLVGGIILMSIYDIQEIYKR